MSLTVVIGVLAAQFATAIVGGVSLLYLAARLWKAPRITWRRSLALCLMLMATSAVGALVARLVAPDRPAEGLLWAVSLFVGVFGLQWWWARFFLGTSSGRALAIWLSAWIPLILCMWAIAVTARDNLLETFIVPTGSMAPNIIGVHADCVCSNCDWPFSVSLSQWEPDRGTLSPERRPCETACINCRKLHRVGIDAEPRAGDRIAVDKRSAVRRWSVIAFRKPPERTELYIKRLVGLPGETVEISGGELFVNGGLLRKDPRTATSLWLPVHDTRFPPRKPDQQTPHWRGQGQVSMSVENQTWTLDGSRERTELEFVGEITDALDYNEKDVWPGTRSVENPVGDVLLTCAISAVTGNGTFGVDWRFHGNHQTTAINSEGEVSIQASSAQDRDLQQPAASGRFERPVGAGDTLSFAVRDRQAYLLVNETLVAIVPFGPENVEAFRAAESGQNLPGTLLIWARGCSLALEYITVKRDIYYLSAADMGPHAAKPGDRAIELAGSEYFVLADNSARGVDSRFFGAVQTADVLGVVHWIYWPVSRWRELD